MDSELVLGGLLHEPGIYELVDQVGGRLVLLELGLHLLHLLLHLRQSGHLLSLFELPLGLLGLLGLDLGTSASALAAGLQQVGGRALRCCWIQCRSVKRCGGCTYY